MGLSAIARGAGRDREEEEQRVEQNAEEEESDQPGGGEGVAQDANEIPKTTTPPVNNRKRPHWTSPKTEEFDSLTAFSDPQIVVERLAERARQHWDKRDSVKEG